jgi:hypothetical protein
MPLTGMVTSVEDEIPSKPTHPQRVLAPRFRSGFGQTAPNLLVFLLLSDKAPKDEDGIEVKVPFRTVRS